MTRLTHSTTSQAAVEGVFAFLLDPERLAAANPATHELVEAAPPPAEVGSTFTWPYRMMGMPLEATLEYTDITPGRRVVLESSKGFVFRFSVEPADSGTNNVWTIGTLDPGENGTLYVQVDVANSLDPGTVLTNEVAIAGRLLLTVTAVETTTVTSAPDLWITLLDLTDPVNAGAELVYQVEGQAFSHSILVST